MKNLCALFFFCSFYLSLSAQKSGNAIATTYTSFLDYQKTFERPAEALSRKEDTLKKQFEAKKLTWPAKYIYLRSFKYDSQLEVWVKNEISEPFQLFKTYRVCALAGTIGPKRMEGDYQVPEGFDYFEKYKQLPVVLVNEKGDYVIDGIFRKSLVEEKPEKVEKVEKKKVVHRTRTIDNLVPAVTKAAEFPGGSDALNSYLKDLG